MGIKLVILGMLMEGKKHPYEIQQLVKERHMEHYIKLAKGSLYYAFEQLEKQGFIKEDSVITDTNRPDKTIYSITKEGEELFQKLLLEQINAHQHMFKPIYSALSFGTTGNSAKMAEQLLKKIQHTEEFLSIMKRVYDMQYPVEDLSNIYIVVGVILQLETELVWLKKLYTDTRDNNLTNIGVPLLKEFQ